MSSPGTSLWTAWRTDPLVFCAAGLILLAVVFGGGGAEGPLRNGWLEAGGALLLTARIAAHFTGKPLPGETLGPLAFIIAVLAIVLFQLIPLPASIWRDLPGRETAVAVADLIGDPTGSRPLSLDPEATRRFGAGLLLPIALFIVTIGTNHRGLRLITRAIVIGALLSALFGAAQIAMGTPEALAPYGRPEAGAASGFFANPNHEAQLMCIGLVAAALLIRLEKPQLRVRGRREFRVHLGWLIFPFLIAIAVASQSRAGLVLLIPALAGAALIAVARRGSVRILAVGVAVVVAIAAIMMLSPGSGTALMEWQAALTTEGRLISLTDILYTLGQFWPWGSGFGTFVPVFQANENLDLVLDVYLNHAHNEYLELLIEAGILGAALMGLAAVLVIWRLSQLLRRASRTGDPIPALTGFGILFLLLLHSVVDYPLRVDSLAAIAGAAAGLLFSPTQKDETGDSVAPQRRRSRRGFRTPGGRSSSPSPGGRPWQ